MAIAGKQRRVAAQDTVIGAGAVLEGSVELEHGLQVRGILRGDRLVARGALLVEPEGQILCRSIEVAEAHILGCVVGELCASRRVHLAAGCQFRGSLKTPLLELEEGAHMQAAPEVGDPGTERKGQDAHEAGQS